MRVTHYQRQPGRFFSVERVFADVRAALPDHIQVRVELCRFESRGLLRRLYNLAEAVWGQGDVNHVTGDVTYLTLLLKRRRTVLTLLDAVSLNRLRGWRYRVLWLLWYWLPMRRAGAVTVISEATRTELLRHGLRDAARALLIPCGVSPAFVPAARAFDAACPRVLQIGAAPHKNIERLAAALEGIPCRLAVVGQLSGSQRAALHRHGIRHECSASLSDAALIDEYRRADLVAFVSTYEGFGLPILEAQAVGRPVVTSRVHSMPEVAGEGACLVDPFDVTSIRAGILRVISDAPYREALVVAGQRNVLGYSYTAVAARYAELYAQVAARARLARP